MKLYVVRNKEGKFFRNIGYGGHGQNWQDSLDKAKFYAKIGQAKSRITFFYNTYSQFGCPDLIEFDLELAGAKVIDMEEVTKKNIIKIKQKELKQKLNNKQYQSEFLRKRIIELKNDLAKLTREK